MVLLEGLVRVLSASERARLLVAHVNHALRGEESDADEALVRERSRDLGLEFRSQRLTWRKEEPSQNSCREKREAFLRSLCNSGADRIFLAHHLNDQAETLFLRLLRGTGARGLRGMLPVNGPKVRPFLSLEKSDLVSAAREWGVEWREDSSNRDLATYDRNWLRGIFPELEARRPGFQRRLAALAEEARGWRFLPGAAFDVHEAAPGVTFARMPNGTVSTRSIAETFSLSRTHAGNLEQLLEKSSGRLDTAGARFTWSGSVLLRERGARFEPKLEVVDGRLKSVLGAWEFPEELALEPRGESGKKEFQSLRVPLFFRHGIPLVRHAGRANALLPPRITGRLKSVKGLRFTPSPLAAWWLAHLD